MHQVWIARDPYLARVKLSRVLKCFFDGSDVVLRTRFVNGGEELLKLFFDVGQFGRGYRHFRLRFNS